MTDFLLQNSWFIPFYGLIGSLVTLPWSLGIIRRTGPRPAVYFNLLMTVMAVVHGSIAFFAVWKGESQHLVFDWLKVADLELALSIEISPRESGGLRSRYGN